MSAGAVPSGWPAGPAGCGSCVLRNATVHRPQPLPPMDPFALFPTALWDMSLASAAAGATVHCALPLLAGAQAAFCVAVMLTLIPAAVSQLPVRSAAAADL